MASLLHLIIREFFHKQRISLQFASIAMNPDPSAVENISCIIVEEEKY
jgi:hypothetical protein